MTNYIDILKVILTSIKNNQQFFPLDISFKLSKLIMYLKYHVIEKKLKSDLINGIESKVPSKKGKDMVNIFFNKYFEWKIRDYNNIYKSLKMWCEGHGVIIEMDEQDNALCVCYKPFSTEKFHNFLKLLEDFNALKGLILYNKINSKLNDINKYMQELEKKVENLNDIIINKETIDKILEILESIFECSISFSKLEYETNTLKSKSKFVRFLHQKHTRKLNGQKRELEERLNSLIEQLKGIINNFGDLEKSTLEFIVKILEREINHIFTITEFSHCKSVIDKLNNKDFALFIRFFVAMKPYYEPKSKKFDFSNLFELINIALEKIKKDIEGKRITVEEGKNELAEKYKTLPVYAKDLIDKNIDILGLSRCLNNKNIDILNSLGCLNDNIIASLVAEAVFGENKIDTIEQLNKLGINFTVDDVCYETLYTKALDALKRCIDTGNFETIHRAKASIYGCIIN